MAEGFTRTRATNILTGNIKSTTCVALSTTTPDINGGNFNEPDPSTGYSRAQFGALNTTIAAQVANNTIIFIYEALEDGGSATHLGLCDSATWGTTPFLTAKLVNPISLGAGYVPLIRAKKLIIGLDVEELNTAYA